MKSLFEQLGGTYHWEGDYLIPDLTLPDEDEQPIGIWGQRHGNWLKREHYALYVTVMLGTKSYRILKLAYPPGRWTPKGEDPEEHYRRIFEFEKHHFSPKTIYRTFWSTNNYSMPSPVPAVDTQIEYWYGEEEKRARRNDLAYTRRVYPQTAPREFKGLAHAELVLMYPERFCEEIVRFLKE